MQRLMAVLTMVAVAWPAAASADDTFFYGDTILVPRVNLSVEDPDRLARCDYLLRGNGAKIWFGNVVEIPLAFADGSRRFTLVDGLMGMTDAIWLTADTVTDTPGADFDVTFVPEMGTCDVPPAGATRFHGVGPEAGVVPAGTRFAIVTMLSAHTPGSTFILEIAG